MLAFKSATLAKRRFRVFEALLPCSHRSTEAQAGPRSSASAAAPIEPKRCSGNRAQLADFRQAFDRRRDSFAKSAAISACSVLWCYRISFDVPCAGTTAGSAASWLAAVAFCSFSSLNLRQSLLCGLSVPFACSPAAEKYGLAIDHQFHRRSHRAKLITGQNRDRTFALSTKLRSSAESLAREALIFARVLRRRRTNIADAR